jgi:hypothetical protein
MTFGRVIPACASRPEPAGMGRECGHQPGDRGGDWGNRRPHGQGFDSPRFRTRMTADAHIFGESKAKVDIID